MLISVKILKGGECDIEVNASASVTRVKEIVAEQLSIPVSHQRLVFKGKTLLDSESLCDYNIVEGNKLHLFVSPPAASEASQATQIDFWEHLHKFLEKHFSSQDAEKVVEEFRKNLSDQLRHLSLEDIERIATQHLDSRKTSPPSPPSGAATQNTPTQS